MYHKDITGSLCVYCGEIATTKDHFPPRSASKSGVLLPACHECNTFIGDRYPFDFDSRCARIKLRIKNKYIKILNLPATTNSISIRKNMVEAAQIISNYDYCTDDHFKIAQFIVDACNEKEKLV